MTSRGLVLRMLVGLALAGSAWGQAPADAMQGFAFDVVSVKPNRTGSNSASVSADNERYQATNVLLKSLIQDAYGLQAREQIIGLPGWANSASYDIDAKFDIETMARLKAASRDEDTKLRRAMMEAMLNDRFRLKVHPETKELPIYELTLAKGGSKMTEAKPGDPKGSMNSSNQKLTVLGIPMSSLCNYLSVRLHRKVVDKTGLTGEYTYTLQWSPDEAAGESPGTTGTSPLPTLFTALQEQLGLKLESGKGPVETIVVDHIEMPSEN